MPHNDDDLQHEAWDAMGRPRFPDRPLNFGTRVVFSVPLSDLPDDPVDVSDAVIEAFRSVPWRAHDATECLRERLARAIEAHRNGE